MPDIGSKHAYCGSNMSVNGSNMSWPMAQTCQRTSQRMAQTCQWPMVQTCQPDNSSKMLVNGSNMLAMANGSNLLVNVSNIPTSQLIGTCPLMVWGNICYLVYICHFADKRDPLLALDACDSNLPKVESWQEN